MPTNCPRTSQKRRSAPFTKQAVVLDAIQVVGPGRFQQAQSLHQRFLTDRRQGDLHDHSEQETRVNVNLWVHPVNWLMHVWYQPSEHCVSRSQWESISCYRWWIVNDKRASLTGTIRLRNSLTGPRHMPAAHGSTQHSTRRATLLANEIYFKSGLL